MQLYRDSLKKCNIKIHKGLGKSCPWYSSVWASNGRSRSFIDPYEAAAMLRRLHHTVVTMPSGWHQAELLARPDMNPAAVDTAIHGLVAGYSCPGDE